MGGNSRVLFVCLHGSAKSLIAMQYFNRLSTEHGLPVRALSAGIEPDDAVPPEVIEGLRADGIDVCSYQPQRVTAGLVASAGHIVSFCPNLDELLAHGSSVEHWHDMPAVSDDYATARDAIVARVQLMFERDEQAAQGAPVPSAGNITGARHQLRSL
jgi:arsenate reductase (thioredoxin)